MSRSATLSFCKPFSLCAKNACTVVVFWRVVLKYTSKITVLTIYQRTCNAAGVRNKNYKIPPKICLEAHSFSKNNILLQSVRLANGSVKNDPKVGTKLVACQKWITIFLFSSNGNSSLWRSSNLRRSIIHPRCKLCKFYTTLPKKNFRLLS